MCERGNLNNSPTKEEVQVKILRELPENYQETI